MGRNASYSDLASGMVLKGRYEMIAPSDVASRPAAFLQGLLTHVEALIRWANGKRKVPCDSVGE